GSIAERCRVPSGWGSSGVERLSEVTPDVVNVLEPDAQTQQAGWDAVALPPGAGLERGCDAAEARCVLDQPQRALHPGGALAVGDVERQHRSERVGVARGYRIAESRIANPQHCRMISEPAGDLERAG